MAVTAASPTRTKGTLRQPARVTINAREWDEARIEFDALRQAALEHCDYAEPRLDFLHPIAIELGPVAEQIVAGTLHSLARLRVRATKAKAPA